MAREKTKYQGVYQREHSTRRHLGKPDVCYDITYKTPSGKKVWEKVGWASEQYNAQLAANIRSERMRQLRHGDITPANKKKMFTVAEGFAIYKRDWLCNLKTGDEDVHKYDTHFGGIANKAMSAVTAHDIDKIKVAMVTKGYSPQSIKLVFSLVRRFYRKMTAWKLYSGPIPTTEVKFPKPDNDRMRYLTEDEAKKLLDAVRVRSRKWHDISFLSLHTGMRLGEILTLRWEDVSLVDGQLHIHVRDAKAGSRMVLLTEEAATMLKDVGPLSTGLVFPQRGSIDKASDKASDSFTRSVKALKLNKGITDRRQRVVFHTLRHTFASWLAIKGVPLFTINKLMGHKTMEMTMRYSHLCPDAKKDAISQLGGMVQRSTVTPPKRTRKKKAPAK